MQFKLEATIVVLFAHFTFNQLLGNVGWNWCLLWCSLLISICLQHQEEFWARHLPPQLTESIYEGLDEVILTMVQSCFGMDISSFSDIAKARLRLPLCNKGYSLRRFEDRRYAQYLGNLLQSVIQLID